MSKLDAKRMAVLKALLERREAELRTAIGAENAAAGQSRGDLAGSAHDRGDEAVIEVQADTQSALASRHFEEWRAVGRALERMAGDEYGICADCGESISPARLEVAPTAERCVACQERHDRSYAHPSTPAM